MNKVNFGSETALYVVTGFSTTYNVYLPKKRIIFEFAGDINFTGGGGNYHVYYLVNASGGFLNLHSHNDPNGVITCVIDYIYYKAYVYINGVLYKTHAITSAYDLFKLKVENNGPITYFNFGVKDFKYPQVNTISVNEYYNYYCKYSNTNVIVNQDKTSIDLLFDLNCKLNNLNKAGTKDYTKVIQKFYDNSDNLIKTQETPLNIIQTIHRDIL